MRQEQAGLRVEALSKERYPRLSERRFVLHVGAPKTGTSALQILCAAGREALAAQAIWYPHLPGDNPYQQHWLVETLLEGDVDGFLRHLDRLEAACPSHVRTLFLSDEGLVNHLQEFPPRGLALLRRFAEVFSPECLYVHREREAFLTSLYRQYLPGSQGWGHGGLYGTSETYAAWRLKPRNQRLADVDWMSERLAGIFGRTRLRAMPYHADIVSDVLAVLPAHLDDAAAGREAIVNASLSNAEAELVRLLNAHGATDAERQFIREAMVAHRAAPSAGADYQTMTPGLRRTLLALDTAAPPSCPAFPIHRDDVEAVRQRLLTRCEARKVRFATAQGPGEQPGAVERRVAALRHVGGTLAEAPFLVAGYTGDARRLARLGATAGPLSEALPPLLGIVKALLEADQALEDDDVVILEGDVAILGDPSPWLAREGIRYGAADGRPPQVLHLSRARLRELGPAWLQAWAEASPWPQAIRGAGSPFPARCCGPSSEAAPVLLLPGTTRQADGQLPYTDQPAMDLSIRLHNTWVTRWNAASAAPTTLRARMARALVRAAAGLKARVRRRLR